MAESAICVGGPNQSVAVSLNFFRRLLTIELLAKSCDGFMHVFRHRISARRLLAMHAPGPQFERAAAIRVGPPAAGWC
jgi:hypothetical protein